MSATVEETFALNFAERGELCASLSVSKDGEEVISLHQGWRDKEKTIPWSADTLVPVWSATKAPAAVATLLALHESGISIHAPARELWPELRADNFDMYLLGWSPGTFDAEHPIRFLASTPNEEKKLGSWNFGGYSNARVDELLPMIQSEIDDSKRQAMLDEVTGILQDEVAYVPMYVQPLVWGAAANVELTQRPDNFFILRWVTVN